jgi:hypothetical protein
MADGLKKIQDKYFEKLTRKVDITPPKHSEAYRERAKRLRTPPSPSKQSYGKNKY